MPSRRAIAAGPSFSSWRRRTRIQRFDRRLAAFVDAARLRGADPFELALATQIGFEFGEHAEPVEKRLARRSAGVDRLFGRLQRVAGSRDPGRGSRDPGVAIERHRVDAGCAERLARCPRQTRNPACRSRLFQCAENVTACRSAKIAPLIAAGRQPHHPDVATIHDVDGAGFREQQVESVDVVQLAVTCRRRAQDVMSANSRSITARKSRQWPILQSRST